ncbi:MAG: hypothetical protein ACFCUI_02480 [Bernardetiaceae bacterium]
MKPLLIPRKEWKQLLLLLLVCVLMFLADQKWGNRALLHPQTQTETKTQDRGFFPNIVGEAHFFWRP